MAQLYDLCQEASGVTLPPAFAEPRLGEVQRSVLDPSLAARELDWQPETALVDGLRATWSWIKG